ncbi:MAG: O-antigen ligase family protein [Chloroflexia bacterium]|nr:O-antigen ligase family protein [Chloroflexia bacterium]
MASASLATIIMLAMLSPSSMVPVAVAVLFLTTFAFVSPVGVLAAAIVSLPYFYRPLGMGSLEFAASEILLAAAVGGSALRVVMDTLRSDHPVGTLTVMVKSMTQSRLVLFLMLVTLAGAGTLLVVYDESARGASLREWRWTLLEPLLFLGLLTMVTRNGAVRPILAGSLIAAGMLAAIHGIVDLAGGGGVAADNIRRLSGPLPHPNALALFMLKPFVLLAALIAAIPELRRMLLLPTILTGFVLFGTFSRGAMIAAGFAVLLLAIDAPRRVRIALGSAAIVTAAAAAVVAGDRMGNLFEGGSVSLRVDIWSSAIAMIRDRPVLGFGPDQFLYAYVPRYIQPTAWDERFTSHAHNLLADSWIRLGIIGAIAAIVVVVFVARQIVNDRTDNIGRSALSKAATVALGATLVHGLIDNAYFGHDLAMSAWLLAWLAFEHSGQKDRRALQDA